MFWIAVIILVFTNVIYLFLGSAEVQPWNNPVSDEKPLKSANGSTTKVESAKFKS